MTPVSSTSRAGHPAWGLDRPHGMTVVELMIVLAIAGMMMGLGVYGLSSVSNSDLRDDAMRVSAAIKYTYSMAALNNAQMRLVFDMNTGEYYTEVSKGPVVEETTNSEATEDFLTEEAQRLADKVEEERDLFDEEEGNALGVNRKVSYERLQDGVLKTTKLSEGTKFARFVKPAAEGEFTDGQVSMSFFPNGFQEQVMLVIKSESGAAFTLVTEPLTGRVLTFSDEIDVPEDFGEVEEDE